MKLKAFIDLIVIKFDVSKEGKEKQSSKSMLILIEQGRRSKTHSYVGDIDNKIKRVKIKAFILLVFHRL